MRTSILSQFKEFNASDFIYSNSEECAEYNPLDSKFSNLKNENSYILPEAKPILLHYQKIATIASLFQQTFIKNIFELEQIVKKMGGKIIKYQPMNFDLNKTFFTCNGESDFTIHTLDDLIPNTKYLSRLIVAQGLGHYILHSQKGKIPCQVSNFTDSIAAKEGFHFSMALLIPDFMFLKMKQDGFNEQEISNMFQIPIEVTKIKKQMIKNK